MDVERNSYLRHKATDVRVCPQKTERFSKGEPSDDVHREVEAYLSEVDNDDAIAGADG